MFSRFVYTSFALAVLVTAVACSQQKARTADDGPSCQEIDDEERFDCFPENGASETACLERGCCWRPPTYRHVHFQTEQSKKNRMLLLDVPYCFYPQGFPNYQVVDSGQYADRSGHVYSLRKANATFRQNEILKLEARVMYETSQRLRVQIVDPNNPNRYQVPVLHPNQNSKIKLGPVDDTDYQVYVNEDPFFIQVFRKSTGKMM